MKDLETQTGVSREAIHFYLREGLLPAPEKPRRNVAFYSQEHVVRIRAIKRLQQDRALSLDTIKGLMERFDYASISTGDNLAEFELHVQSLVGGDLPAPDETVEAVSERTGLEVTEIEALAARNVVRIAEKDGRRWLDFRDAGLVQSWADVLAIGFAGHGAYDADYVARFASVLSDIAAAEVATFLDTFSYLPTEAAGEMAARGINATNELVTRLRTQALMRHLHERVARRAH